MYPAAFLDHFRHPRLQGALSDATHRAMVEDPACGDRLWLDLRVAGGRIAAVRFRVQGCSGAIAAGSALAALLEGRPAVADAVTRDELDATLGGLPPNKRHALRAAVDVLRRALETPA